MRLVWGSVVEAGPATDGMQSLMVELAVDPGNPARAVAYPQLSGDCRRGDLVLLNTTAVDLGLGTGGVHFVVAVAGSGRTASSADPVALDAPSGGHVMKLRYTPLQVDVDAVEEPDGPHYATMQTAEDLAGMPVVCCGLHSQMPLVAAAVKSTRPEARVAYCQADFGSLPFGFSDVARASREAGLLDLTVSCGQAFGAELEAVNLHSGLLAARHVGGADVGIVAIGPGMVGTATPFGHGGVAQGEALNAAAALGGRPVAVLRISFADRRDRHRVLSHHTVVALTRVVLVPVLVAVPRLASEEAAALEAAMDRAGLWARHERVDTPVESVPDEALRCVEVRTMGRSYRDDPAFFLGAYSAGRVAADLLQ